MGIGVQVGVGVIRGERGVKETRRLMAILSTTSRLMIQKTRWYRWLRVVLRFMGCPRWVEGDTAL